MDILTFLIVVGLFILAMWAINHYLGAPEKRILSIIVVVLFVVWVLQVAGLFSGLSWFNRPLTHPVGMAWHQIKSIWA